MNLEEKILFQIQQRVLTIPRTSTFAKGLSLFGEHALGWVAIAVAGGTLNKKNKKNWIKMGVGTIFAHGLSIVIKRIVRRPRPNNNNILVGVSTPSQLSFPSSHSTSTAAAAVLLANALGVKSWKMLLIFLSPMMFSRLLLGVHYPSDVLSGAIIGITSGEIVKKLG